MVRKLIKPQTRKKEELRECVDAENAGLIEAGLIKMAGTRFYEIVKNFRQRTQYRCLTRAERRFLARMVNGDLRDRRHNYELFARTSGLKGRQ